MTWNLKRNSSFISMAFWRMDGRWWERSQSETGWQVAGKVLSLRLDGR